MKSHLVLILTLVLATSCYKEVPYTREVEIFSSTGQNVFDLKVPAHVQHFINTSWDTSYSVEAPDIKLVLNDYNLDLKEIKVRGRSALKFHRKSFSVKLDIPMVVPGREGGFSKSLSRFKLLALAMDYTYIENRIAFGLMEQVGIMPLYYTFVEFQINGDTQGVYLLVEDPEQYFVDQGSEFILRRAYHHGISDSRYKPSLNSISEETYINRFNEIYDFLPDYHGDELYNKLLSRFDLKQYFLKMGMDYLLMNGDYTDEIYFYSTAYQGDIQFMIIPWDYDDIFKDHPHEVGVSWGIGKIFGDRTYPTQQDIYNEIGEKLIFSIEDDLDYVIAKDSILYLAYEAVLTALINELNSSVFENLFQTISQELTPYYEDPDIVAQSRFDADSTNLELWRTNMDQKKFLLEERLDHIKNQLNSR